MKDMMPKEFSFLDIGPEAASLLGKSRKET
jgi:hypothetical protein